MSTVRGVRCAAVILLLCALSRAQVPNVQGVCVANCGGGNPSSRGNNAPRNLPKSPMQLEVDKQFKYYQRTWDRDHATIRSVNGLLEKSQNQIAKRQCSQALGSLQRAQKLLDLDDLQPNFAPRNYYQNLYTPLLVRKQQMQQSVQSSMANLRSGCAPSAVASVARPPRIAVPPPEVELPTQAIVLPPPEVASVHVEAVATPQETASPQGKFAPGVRIGAAASVKGEVYRIASDNRQEPLQSGMTVSLNDRIVTGPNGHMQILLLDQTVFTVGPESDVAVDEFVYDPDNSAGKATVRIAKGVFRLVTGKLKLTDAEHMKVKLPVGTIGIRGTDLSLKYEPGREGYIKLASGSIEITPANGGTPFLMTPGQKAAIRADGSIAPPNASRTEQAGRQ